MCLLAQGLPGLRWRTARAEKEAKDKRREAKKTEEEGVEVSSEEPAVVEVDGATGED